MLRNAHPIVPFPSSSLELDFRSPLQVTEMIYLSHMHTAYPRCPRCHASLDREYMAFCNCCGQHLDWAYIDKATVLFR